MGLIFLAFGLVFIVEGLAYALAPSLIERMLEALKSLPLQARRLAGLLCVVTGFMLVWSAYQLGF